MDSEGVFKWVDDGLVITSAMYSALFPEQALALKSQVVRFKKKTNGGLGMTQLGGQIVTTSLLACIDRCLKAHQEKCFCVSYNKGTKRCTPGGLNGVRAWQPQALDSIYTRETVCDGHQPFKLYTINSAMSCLWLSNDQVDYSLANTKCTTMHAHLITLKERSKVEVLKRAVSGRKGPFWIGLDDMDSEGNFKWVDDGRVITTTMYSALFSKNKPDDQGGEDCVTYGDEVDFFNDEKCDKNEYYICEISLLT
ncbi:unnamed protein product [Lymnaea stagnalis]|uniref:C-type lectin domain-containing protein n=1 Tax=Lymnaea stagnalis TaxID=6523 RepID=A0AAV2GX98_LYMST